MKIDSTVEIKIVGDKCLAIVPYHPTLIATARKLNGKWKKPAWEFDARDAERVQRACRAIFGTAGELVATCTIRVKAEFWEHSPSLYLCGREVAHRTSRDYVVRLGEGVVCIAGGFQASGGSVKYPTLQPREGTVLEVRDVPLSLAKEETEAYEGDPVSIVDGSIIDPSTPEPDPRVVALEAIKHLMTEHGIAIEDLREIF